MALDLKFYLSIFWRRFPYFLIVTTLIGAIGVSIASVLPARYWATALLLVEDPQIPPSMAASTVRTSAAQEVAIIQRRLTTRATLIDAANRLGVYRDRPDLTPDEVAADMRNRLVIHAGGMGRNSRGAPTVSVMFQDRDPRLAAQVVNEFVGMIERENAEMRRGVAGETLRFFSDEVNRLSREISIQRARILEFRLQNRDSLPESMDFRRNRMAMLQDRLGQFDRDVAALEERRDFMVELFETTGRLSQDPTEAERELQQARGELQNATRLYSPQNPRVRMIQARVDELENFVNQETTGSADDVAARFEEMLAEMEAQKAAIETRRNEAEAEIARLQETLDNTATIGIRLSEMERELQAVQSQHNSAVDRLAQAQMGERIELLSKGQRITVLEQASVPNTPATPNRPQIAAAGVGAGMAAGLGLIALLELLNRSIRRPIEITRKMGITPIAALPYVRTRRQMLFRRIVIGAALVFSLVGVPLILWALHTYYLPLDLLINRIMEFTGINRLLANFQ
jgi:polysaccharide biosynthesis transport protein